jgi:hypothetical protein
MWSLRSRGPAHAISHRCLAAQEAATPRHFLARLIGIDPLHPGARAAYAEALDARRVGRQLARLGSSWRVLHAVPYGDGRSIDHLLVGPPGVIALHVDAFEAECAATAASRLLSRATGTGVTALPLATPFDVRDLARVLRDLPVAYGPDLVATVARAAEEWTTWHPFGVDALPLADPEPAFEVLHGEVGRARGRRVAWGVGGLVALAAVVLATAVGIVP